MIRLAISVEGQIEEEFVKDFLAYHLRERGVEPTPILLGRARGGSAGGNVSAERLVSEMAHLFHSFDAVTSLVDFYGFRRKGERTVDESVQRLGNEPGVAVKLRLNHRVDNRLKRDTAWPSTPGIKS